MKAVNREAEIASLLISDLALPFLAGLSCISHLRRVIQIRMTGAPPRADSEGGWTPRGIRY